MPEVADSGIAVRPEPVRSLPGHLPREEIVQTPAPVSVVARGKVTFATLAHVVVSEFDHHLPLYRQAEMMAAQGLDIDRSTLAGWTGQAATLLDPIVSRICAEVLKADKIHADDTPVPVLDPGRGKIVTGRLWVYAASDQASSGTAPRAICYCFTPACGRLIPMDMRTETTYRPAKDRRQRRSKGSRSTPPPSSQRVSFLYASRVGRSAASPMRRRLSSS